MLLRGEVSIDLSQDLLEHLLGDGFFVDIFDAERPQVFAEVGRCECSQEYENRIVNF